MGGTELISIREVSSLEAIGEHAWSALVRRSPQATVFQSFGWLTAWWQSFAEGTPWILTAWDKGVLVGAAALYLDERKTVRFIGEGHADYGTFLLAEDRREVLEALLGHLFSRPCRWRSLQLSCVPGSSALAEELHRHGAWGFERIPCPRVLFEARSAESLLSKESLRRHAKKLKGHGKVEVQHLDHAQDIEPYLEVFFRQHRERWAFTLTPSLFTDTRQQAFYRRLAATAVPGGSVLFTVVKVAGTPVAMHFGFRSEGQIIWYKPTFDPRLSRLGPGEVLLAEIIRQTAAEGALGLDFTRGDESFKLRFASEVREVISFTAESSRMRGYLAHCKFRLREATILMLERLGLRAPAASIWKGASAAYHVGRVRGVQAMIKGARERLRKHGPVCVKLYARAAHKSDYSLKPGLSIRSGQTPAELLELLDLEDPQQQAVLATAPVYLAVGGKLWVIEQDGHAASCGWELQSTGINVTEIGARLEFPQSSALLMEFCTFSRYRGKGYYGTLLKSISPTGRTQQYLIYALKHNTPSIRAIENAQFEPLAQLHRSMGGGLRLCPERSSPKVQLSYLKKHR